MGEGETRGTRQGRNHGATGSWTGICRKPKLGVYMLTTLHNPEPRKALKASLPWDRHLLDSPLRVTYASSWKNTTLDALHLADT